MSRESLDRGGARVASRGKECVRILTSLPRTVSKHKVAALYYDVFRQKYDGLLMIPRSREQALRVLTASIDCSMGIYAVDERGDLVGLVGLGCSDRGFVKYTWKLLLREFGLCGAIRRKVIKFFESPRLLRDELRIEGIVVANAAQGKGVGTTLMDAVTEWAAQRGYGSVRLEVINSNPRARSLYQRLGFHDTGRSYYGPLTRRAGFTSIWRMRKELR
ncbi:MAG: GNAT family N-acetyltransferase [Spirochaetaceae bacterium]|nr:MAG: GNAT family N-acetyltransferase [Spirochaetaceae bacterium]